MIRIDMSFESGAQAREEMHSLLFGSAFPMPEAEPTLSLQERRALQPNNEPALPDVNSPEFLEAQARITNAIVNGVDDAPAAEPAKRTRRTKAQIAADEAAAEAAWAATEAFKAAVTGTTAETTAAEASEQPEEQGRAEQDEGDDPNIPLNAPPSATHAHRAAEYLAANPGTTPLQHMKAELTKVNDKFGLDEVRKLMVGFGIPRIGEVPAEQYPALLAVIDKRLAA